MSAHGNPAHTIPWKLYYNTIVAGIGAGAPADSYIGLGQFGDRQAIVDSPHEVFNNVILVRDGRPLGRDTWVDTGAEIYDGNVYWGWSGLSSSTYTSIWRFLHRSGMTVDGETIDGENPPSSIGDVNKLQDMARHDSQTYYFPGWEAAGLFVDPQLESHYRPRNPALASGAVDLTAKGWPGTGVYVPWRGALQP